MSDKPRTKRILIVNRKPPHGSLAMKDGIDSALICSAFGQNISVLFLDDGVYQLLKHQQPDSIHGKNHSANFAAFEMYDINNIFVDADALSSRGLSSEDLLISLQQLTPEEISRLMENQDVILNS